MTRAHMDMGLARTLAQQIDTQQGEPMRLRRAVVTAVDTAQVTCTIQLAGDPLNVAGVPYLIAPAVNDVVTVMQSGPSLLVLGTNGGAGQATAPAAGDADWIAATYQNGWTTYGGEYAPAGYRKDAEGWVHLRGLVKSGTMGAAIFTLPTGYLPAYRYLYVAISNGAIGRVDVPTNGQVLAVGGSNAWISLDGMSFHAAA